MRARPSRIRGAKITERSTHVMHLTLLRGIAARDPFGCSVPDPSKWISGSPPRADSEVSKRNSRVTQRCKKINT